MEYGMGPFLHPSLYPRGRDGDGVVMCYNERLAWFQSKPGIRGQEPSKGLKHASR